MAGRVNYLRGFAGRVDYLRGGPGSLTWLKHLFSFFWCKHYLILFYITTLFYFTSSKIYVFKVSEVEYAFENTIHPSQM